MLTILLGGASLVLGFVWTAPEGIQIHGLIASAVGGFLVTHGAFRMSRL